MRQLRLAVLIALGCALGGTRANASVILSLGTLDTAPAIVINPSGPAFTLTGTVVGEPSAIVTFSSTERLVAIGDGEAGLTGADGVLTNITVAMPGGATFRSLALNPLIGEGALAGTATISVVGTASGTNTFNLNLGRKGSNHFNVTAANEGISSIALFALGGFTDLRQPRIETIDTGIAAVPEPGTAVLIVVGLGAVIVGRIRRSRQNWTPIPDKPRHPVEQP